jgi:uncharacterized protein YbaR (Trm112 family)/SAM-dependent methyltransferase
MDARLLPMLGCPMCREPLVFEGEVRNGRVTNGSLSCTDGGLCFAVRDGVAVFTSGHAIDNGPTWGAEWAHSKRTVYERAAARTEREYCSNVAWREMVDAALRCQGLVVDVATGPGGSLSSPYLRRAAGDACFVFTDLSEPVVRGQQAFFQDAGMAHGVSFLVCDACNLPFLGGAAAAVTSTVGFANVAHDRTAYREVGRVLQAGGWLMDAERLYEPGSRSADLVKQWGSCLATIDGWHDVLTAAGLVVERTAEWISGRGKGDPDDGLPLDEDGWTNLIVFARKQSHCPMDALQAVRHHREGADTHHLREKNDA